jgi:hypothetical protein
MKKKTLCLMLILLVLALSVACRTAPAEAETPSEPEGLADGSYRIDVTLTGGTGKAKIASPLQLVVKDGQMSAVIIWSSANYDYMKVNDVRYDAVIEDGHSVFTVPVASLEEPLPVVADTVAMSTPHEIEYTIVFDPATLAADPA